MVVCPCWACVLSHADWLFIVGCSCYLFLWVLIAFTWYQSLWLFSIAICDCCSFHLLLLLFSILSCCLVSVFVVVQSSRRQIEKSLVINNDKQTKNHDNDNNVINNDKQTNNNDNNVINNDKQWQSWRGASPVKNSRHRLWALFVCFVSLTSAKLKPTNKQQWTTKNSKQTTNNEQPTMQPNNNQQ